jgi:hypothetical protein
VWKPYPTKFDQPKNEKKKNTNQKVLDSTSDEQY